MNFHHKYTDKHEETKTLFVIPSIIDQTEFNPENVSVFLTLFSIHWFTSTANARHTMQPIRIGGYIYMHKYMNLNEGQTESFSMYLIML